MTDAPGGSRRVALRRTVKVVGATTHRVWPRTSRTARRRWSGASAHHSGTAVPGAKGTTPTAMSLQCPGPATHVRPQGRRAALAYHSAPCPSACTASLERARPSRRRRRTDCAGRRRLRWCSLRSVGPVHDRRPGGRAPIPSLEALVPRDLDGAAPTSVDSGRNCTPTSLASLIAHGVTELRFAGSTWETGSNSGVTIAVFEARGAARRLGSRVLPDRRRERPKQRSRSSRRRSRSTGSPASGSTRSTASRTRRSSTGRTAIASGSSWSRASSARSRRRSTTRSVVAGAIDAAGRRPADALRATRRNASETPRGPAAVPTGPIRCTLRHDQLGSPLPSSSGATSQGRAAHHGLRARPARLGRATTPGP